MAADHLPRLPAGVVAFLEKPLTLALVLDALRAESIAPAPARDER